MGLHERLGSLSVARCLCDDVLKRIMEHCRWQQACGDVRELVEALRLSYPLAGEELVQALCSAV